MTVRKEEARRLTREWEEALHRLAESSIPGRHQEVAEEQEAYDRLIDFIEANGLNYTDLDPRENR